MVYNHWPFCVGRHLTLKDKNIMQIIYMFVFLGKKCSTQPHICGHPLMRDFRFSLQNILIMDIYDLDAFLYEE